MASKPLSFMCLCLLLVLETCAQHHAGDILSTTDYSIVMEALDEVLHADGEVDVGRRCAIGVSNLGSSSLTNPRWYTKSGKIFEPFPATDVPSENTGLSLFHKTSFYATGTSGILSYDISDTQHKVVIMWEVPWDRNLYDTKFNIKVYHRNIPTDKDMFKQMVNLAGSKTPKEGWVERTEHGIELRGTITADKLARYYVSVDADGYNFFQPPDLHSKCNYHAGWVGKYCWQECNPNGYCWVDQKCKTSEDCQGPLRCYTPCKKRT